MPSGILVLLRNEIAKTIRTKLPYFGLLATLSLCCIAFLTARGQNETDIGNAWGFVAFAMQVAFTDIGIIFVVVFSSTLLAEEMLSGTVRVILSCPVSRLELYLAKVAAGLLYMITISLACLTLSMLLAQVRYSFGDIVDVVGPVYSAQEALGHLLLACVLSWVPLACLVLFGMLISTLIGRPGPAVAVSIGALYLLDFVRHRLALDPYIFTRFMQYPWKVLQIMAQGVECRWTPEVWRMLGLSSLYLVLLFAAGLLVFLRRDFR